MEGMQALVVSCTPGKHQGPSRLEHEGPGSPGPAEQGARQIQAAKPGSVPPWCCHCRITKCWRSEGKGLPAHSGPADLSTQHRFHTNQVIMGTVNP